MKKFTTHYRILFGLIIAHLLMYITFQDKAIFWYMFTGSLFILISYSILHEKIENEATSLTYSMYGISSGIVLFLLFWTGHTLINLFDLPFSQEISKLYRHFSPTQIWHYIALFLIIIPGEELFWRGFIQKRLSTSLGVTSSVIIAALLYASIQIYSGYFIHIFAALIAGIFWGILYAWKKSIPLIIVSHLIFDLFIFILFPFR